MGQINSLSLSHSDLFLPTLLGAEGYYSTWLHTHTMVEVPWTSDRPVAGTSTCTTHTALTTDKHSCNRRESNPLSQQASSHRPAPQTARPMG
jgi:hypothetical protein